MPPSRGVGAKKRNAKAALDAMRRAREEGRSGLENVEDHDDAPVYDVVNEEEYQKIVEDRRSAGDFVVDDGVGYFDDGEEHLGEDDAGSGKKKKKRGTNAALTSSALKRARRLNESIDKNISSSGSSMWKYMKQSGAVLGPDTMETADGAGAPRSKKSAPKASALDLDNLLDDLQSNPTSRKAQAKRKRGDLHRSARKSTPSAARNRRPRDTRADHPASDAMAIREESADDDAPPPMDDDAGPMDEAPSAEERAAAPGEASPGSAAPAAEDGPKAESPAAPAKPSSRFARTLKTRKLNATAPAQAAMSGGRGGQDGSTFGDFSGAAGEGASRAAGTAVKTLSAAEIEGAVQVNEAGESVLRFFWMDAYEKEGNIYLFGKIRVPTADNQPARFASCCVVVRNVMRTLLVLPAEAGNGELDSEGNVARCGLTEVYGELNSLLVPSCIPKHAVGEKFKCKVVKRKYAFDKSAVPRDETDYLKVKYSARFPAPKAEDAGTRWGHSGSAIQEVFGSTTSALEQFILKRKLMGPCWIDITSPAVNHGRVSWCKAEFSVDDPKLIRKVMNAPPNPPVVTLTLSLKTVLNPSSHTHEVVAVAGIFHRSISTDGPTDQNPKHMTRILAVRALGGSAGQGYAPRFPHDLPAHIARAKATGMLMTLPNERALLNVLLNRIGEEDPDVIVGHNFHFFGGDVLLQRAVANKVPAWSKLGRLRRMSAPRQLSNFFPTACAGRIIVDTQASAREFLRETTYTLPHLAGTQLKEALQEVAPGDVPRFFGAADTIIKLANHTAFESYLTQKLLIKLQVVPLTVQLTNISGNLWSRTVRGKRAERIEYLLLHEFHQKKFIVPERVAYQGGKGGGGKKKGDNSETDNLNVGGSGRKRGKPAYTGGLVLEPKKGLYDSYILLLDFNSLYPSIIQEYNLCFTTIDWTRYVEQQPAAPTTAYDISGDGDAAAVEMEIAEDAPQDMLPDVPDEAIDTGILPRVIRTLVERRRNVKQLLKRESDPVKKQQLDIRQKALKLTANSMYGCLGFSFSRFYAKPIAALVTSKGRDTLQHTVGLAQDSLNLEVIYGDTDSIMVNAATTDLAHARSLANQVKKEVNKLYKTLEIDLDGIYKCMLLLKKKKYAALIVSGDPKEDGTIPTEREVKGLDLVRRDWCQLSKDVGNYVLDQILSSQGSETVVANIHEHLSALATKLRAGEIDIGKFVITKGLNKHPREYPDAKGQPHIQVAISMLRAGKPVNVGDHIPYVVCEQMAGSAPAQGQGPKDSPGPAASPTSEKENASPAKAASAGSSKGAADRAYHPEEVVKSSGAITPDVEWYLAQQILPPIARLCEPVAGTSQQMLAQHLGLDASRFAGSAGADAGEDDFGLVPAGQLDDKERFRDCAKLRLKCLKCSAEGDFAGVFRVQERPGLATKVTSGLDCPSCGAALWGSPNAASCFARLSNRLNLSIRGHQRKYYNPVLKCDDDSCGLRTRQQSVVGTRCFARGCRTGKFRATFDERALYTQLKYFETLFDEPRAVVKLQESGAPNPPRLVPDHSVILGLLKRQMSETVAASAYNWIRPSLFSAVFGTRSKRPAQAVVRPTVAVADA